MEFKISLVVIWIFLNGCAGKESSENLSVQKEVSMNKQSVFDSTYAKDLGADDYGMHEYVMALLKAGPNRNQTPKEAEELQRAHMDNITRMAEEGVLVLAGPFLDEGELKGIYIFDVKTIAEAEKLTSTDPAIKAGSLVMELHPWYGSAGVMAITEIHEKIAKIKF